MMAVCLGENFVGDRHSVNTRAENREPSLWHSKGTDGE